MSTSSPSLPPHPSHPSHTALPHSIPPSPSLPTSSTASPSAPPAAHFPHSALPDISAPELKTETIDEDSGLVSTPTSASGSRRRVYVCSHPGCSKAFGRRDYLERHAANHMTSRPHVCPTCGKSYARADVLKRHVSNHPRVRDKPIGRRGSGPRRSDVLIKSSPPDSSPPPASAIPTDDDQADVAAPGIAGRVGDMVVENGPGSVPTNDTPSTSTTTPVNADYGAGLCWAKYEAEYNNAQAVQAQAQQSQVQAIGGNAHTQAQVPSQPATQAFTFDPSSSQVNAQPSTVPGPSQPSYPSSSYNPTAGVIPQLGTTPALAQPDLSQVAMFNFDTGETIANDLYTWFLTSDLNELLPAYGSALGQGDMMVDTGVPAIANPAGTSGLSGTNGMASGHAGYAANNGAGQLQQQGQGQGHMGMVKQELGAPFAPDIHQGMSTTVQGHQNSWLSAMEHGFDIDESATEGADRLIGAAMTRKIHEEVFQMFGVRLPKEGFSAADMNLYIDLFYLHFDPLFPVIHRPTLKARDPPTILLLAILSIGSAFSSDRGAYRVFVEMHKKLRRHVFDMVEGHPHASTQVLQTLVLVSYFGRIYSTSHDYDVNQLYYSSIVTVSRYSGLFTASTTHWTHAKLVGPAAWCTWAEAEERIRLAWMVFVCDQSNAAFFRQGLLLQSSNMDVPLPCNDAAWGADTAEAWAQDRGEEPLSFRTTLRQLLDETTLPPGLDSFALWAVLHGLVALANSLSSQRPDMFTLARRTQITAWKGIVYRAFALWHQTALNILAASTDPAALAHLRAGVPICNICIIILLTDLDAVRMFGGAPRLGGREIRLEERTLARARLETWAQSSEGRQSCWFALELLQQVFRWSGEGEVNVLPPTTQWCIYLATVTVWAFTTLVEERHVDVKRLNLVGPYTKCRVEPTLARRSALTYCERVLACEDPVNLPAIPEIGQCLAVIAYTAYLCGAVGQERGNIAGPTRVLYNLLRITETRKRNTFVTC